MHDAMIHAQVRQQIIRLEAAVFGNEVTEGLLPADVLPQRVQQLSDVSWLRNHMRVVSGHDWMGFTGGCTCAETK